MAHNLQNKQAATGCTPSIPVPQTEDEYCEGKVLMKCCCPRLYSRTFVLQLGPQTEPQLQAFGQNTVNAYEAGGYVILGHSLVDTGAGWVFGLTVGWYA